VGLAIQQSAALSVDTASGAEEPRGTKSAEKIESFVKASQRAFDG
jgi:phosphoribosylanthranilate isomerase